MSKKKMTRRALFTSVISLILCLVMLTGTTFAWFTDSETSGRNVIKSGNLDVTLEYWDGTEYKPVTTTTQLFDDNALWEPGYTEVAYLKVTNVGNLALKYQLDVNVYSETPGTNVYNEAFNLSDYLVFKAVDSKTDLVGTYTRETAKDAAGIEMGLKTYNSAVKDLISTGDADYIALIIYMPESVDNHANHLINTNPPTIEMGVVLNATQKTNESDTFGPDYDEDATYADVVYHVDANNSLADTLKAIEAEDDEIVMIELDQDVEWVTGAGIGSTPWIGENAKVKTLIVDANGHTITATGDGVGAICMANGGTLTIKNGTVKDESKSYAEDAWEYTYLEFDGNLNFKNVKFSGGIMVEGENAAFTNCTFDTQEDSVYAVWVSNGNASFSGCTFTGTRGLKTHEDYGTEVGTVVVDNCTFRDISKKPGIAIGNLNASTTVSIKNSTFINCQAGDQGLYIYETDTNVDTFNFTSQNNKVVKSENVSDSDALLEAIKNGATQINLSAGNYVMPDGSDVNLQGKTLTISGGKDAVIDVTGIDERDQFVTGANLTFEGVTLNFGTTIYMGFANTASLTYKNCDINGLQCCYGSGKTSFVNCDLNSNGAEHSVWTWGGQNISFTDCDFTYGDRAVNCYGEGVTTNVSFTDCTFTKVAGKDSTGAIETNSSALTGLNLTINNCSVNEDDLWWVSTWDSKGGANTKVTVDGKSTVATAAMLASAVQAGKTELYLLDGEYDVYGCGGKDLTINGSENVVLKLTNEGEEGCDYGFGGNGTGVGHVTFNGVTIDTTGNTGNYKGYAYMKGTFNDCNFVGAYSLNNANDFVFNRCTFDFKNGYFWTWGAKSVTFDTCTFNGNSKCILAHGYESTVITIKDCKFAATEKGYTGSGDNTACVEIDPAGTNTYTIKFTGENSKTDSYAGWTRVKDGSTGHTITGIA